MTCAENFRRRLDAAPIKATSILNGMFTDLLTGQAPFIIFKLHRVVYWENADQPLDFTTMDDVAAFTASAATDDGTPRDLRIAGDTLTARRLSQAASNATDNAFSVFRAGPLTRLETASTRISWRRCPIGLPKSSNTFWRAVPRSGAWTSLDAYVTRDSSRASKFATSPKPRRIVAVRCCSSAVR